MKKSTEGTNGENHNQIICYDIDFASASEIDDSNSRAVHGQQSLAQKDAEIGMRSLQYL